MDLWCNKVLRRCLPVFLLGFFISNLWLATTGCIILIIPLFLQAAFYLAGFSYPLIFRHLPGFTFLKKITSTVFFFHVGNLGMLLGLYDFLRGRQPEKWIPVKLDEVKEK